MFNYGLLQRQCRFRGFSERIYADDFAWTGLQQNCGYGERITGVSPAFDYGPYTGGNAAVFPGWELTGLQWGDLLV